jgi:hypothetical protein
MGQLNYKSPRSSMLLVARKNLFSKRIRLAQIDPVTEFKG